MFKARDYLDNKVCQTCTIFIYFHFSFTAFEMWSKASHYDCHIPP